MQTQVRAYSSVRTSSRLCTQEYVETHAFVHAGYKHKYGHIECLHALARVLSQEVEAPTSLHSRAQRQPLDANFVPRASQRRASPAAPALRPLLSGLPGVHHAEAARAGARNGGQGRGGAGAGRPGAAPTPDSWQGAPPPPCAGARHGARSRVPSDAHQDTKGWRESTEHGQRLRSG